MTLRKTKKLIQSGRLPAQMRAVARASAGAAESFKKTARALKQPWRCWWPGLRGEGDPRC